MFQSLQTMMWSQTSLKLIITDSTMDGEVIATAGGRSPYITMLIAWRGHCYHNDLSHAWYWRDSNASTKRTLTEGLLVMELLINLQVKRSVSSYFLTGISETVFVSVSTCGGYNYNIVSDHSEQTRWLILIKFCKNFVEQKSRLRFIMNEFTLAVLK